jgi:hypothetical protein
MFAIGADHKDAGLIAWRSRVESLRKFLDKLNCVELSENFALIRLDSGQKRP